MLCIDPQCRHDSIGFSSCLDITGLRKEGVYHSGSIYLLNFAGPSIDYCCFYFKTRRKPPRPCAISLGVCPPLLHLQPRTGSLPCIVLPLPYHSLSFGGPVKFHQLAFVRSQHSGLSHLPCLAVDNPHRTPLPLFHLFQKVVSHSWTRKKKT